MRANGPLLFLNQGNGKFPQSLTRFSSPRPREGPSPVRPPPITIETAGWTSIFVCMSIIKAQISTSILFLTTPRKTARPIF